MKILVMNGPNLNMLGIREPDIYGKSTYADLCKMIEAHCAEKGVEFEIYQSNYEGDLVTKIQQALGVFDGIVMWTWKESDVPLIPEKWELFKAMTPKNRRMFGCYLWNFGESKQATAKAVKWQLDFYREQILKGEAEGVVLHTNTMADLDYEAYDAAIEWMNEHGDEEIPF